VLSSQEQLEPAEADSVLPADPAAPSRTAYHGTAPGCHRLTVLAAAHLTAAEPSGVARVAAAGAAMAG
jgi:hypothetical protein